MCSSDLVDDVDLVQTVAPAARRAWGAGIFMLFDCYRAETARHKKRRPLTTVRGLAFDTSGHIEGVAGLQSNLAYGRQADGRYFT